MAYDIQVTRPYNVDRFQLRTFTTAVLRTIHKLRKPNSLFTQWYLAIYGFAFFLTQAIVSINKENRRSAGKHAFTYI